MLILMKAHWFGKAIYSFSTANIITKGMTIIHSGYWTSLTVSTARETLFQSNHIVSFPSWTFSSLINEFLSLGMRSQFYTHFTTTAWPSDRHQTYCSFSALAHTSTTLQTVINETSAHRFCTVCHPRCLAQNMHLSMPSVEQERPPHEKS